MKIDYKLLNLKKDKYGELKQKHVIYNKTVMKVGSMFHSVASQTVMRKTGNKKAKKMENLLWTFISILFFL